MAIALVGVSDLAVTKDGGLSVAWPDGSAAGHTGVFVAATGGGGKPPTRLPNGWKLLIVTSAKEAVYGKLVLTGTDVGAALPVNAVVSGLLVFSGVVAFGRRSPHRGLTLTGQDDAVVVFGRKTGSGTAITPPTDRVFATDAINDEFKKSGKKWLKRRYNAWVKIPGESGYCAVEGSNTDSMVAVALVGSVSPLDNARSMTPTIVTPADDSTVKQNSRYSFDWALPTAYKSKQWRMRQVQLRAKGAASWGSVANGTWTPSNASRTELSSFTKSQSRTYSTTLLPVGDYEWRVRMRYGTDGDNVWSEWSETAGFTVAVPPVVGPVTMTDSLSPVISWSVASGDQAYYEVEVLDSPTNRRFESGLIESTTDQVFEVGPLDLDEWANGTAVYGKVFITSSAGLRSPGVSSPVLLVDWTPPPALTGGEVWGTTLPMTLRVDGVEPLVHDKIRAVWTAHGVRHEVVQPASAGQFILPLAPFGEVSFEVSASKRQDDVTIWSDPITISGTNSDRSEYFVAEDSSSYRRVHIASDPGRTEQVGVTAVAPLGSSQVVIVESASAGDTGTVTVGVETQAEKADLREWLEANRRWWIRRAPERWVRQGQVWADVPPDLVARTGGWAETRFTDGSPAQHRGITIPWVEQTP